MTASRDRARELVRLLKTDERRHALAWWRSFRPGWLVDNEVPWLTFGAVEHLRHFLDEHPSARVFEYGSGGSTLFWLSRGAHVTSVEHDPDWYEQVRDRVGPTDSLDYRLVLPEARDPAAPLSDPADPAAFASLDETHRHDSFERYVRQIDDFEDGHFDVVLVDGRARSSCVQHALAKVRPGGLLVLDNADRDYYLARVTGLEGFTRTALVGHAPSNVAPCRTDLFQRPEATSP